MAPLRPAYGWPADIADEDAIGGHGCRPPDDRPIARSEGEPMALMLVFSFGVTLGLATMYAICDLVLAEPEREELSQLLHRPARRG